MTWKPIDGRALTVAELETHISLLPSKTWASGMTLHNTSAPSLRQRPQGFSAQHIQNLVTYFRDDRGWSSGPHCFVDDTAKPFHLFTKFTDKGTHSPSWNGTKIGIEMLGEYASEDPYSGRGLKVVRNTALLFALLHEHYGWDPTTIKMHYEDPATTHACPGKLVVKEKFIEMVQEFMGHAGELTHEEDYTVPLPPVKPPVGAITHTPKDTLNLRQASTASSPIIGVLPDKTVVRVLTTAMNGTTKWARVEVTLDGYNNTGWVADRYLTRT